MGLSDKAIRAMKASVPLLESSGVEITGRMYGRMMPENPALKGMFNMSHLRHVTDNNVGPENSLQVLGHYLILRHVCTT